MKTCQNGKGSSLKNPNFKAYSEGYDRIFKKCPKIEPECPTSAELLNRCTITPFPAKREYRAI